MAYSSPQRTAAHSPMGRGASPPHRSPLMMHGSPSHTPYAPPPGAYSPMGSPLHVGSHQRWGSTDPRSGAPVQTVHELWCGGNASEAKGYDEHGAPHALELLYQRERQFLFAACSDGNIRVFNLTTLSLHTVLHGHARSVLSMAASASLLFSASSDNSIMVWDLETLEHKCTLRGQYGNIYALAVSENMNLYAGCQDTSIKRIPIKSIFPPPASSSSSSSLFDPPAVEVPASHVDDANVEVLGRHSGFVYSLAVDNGILSAGGDGMMKEWDLEASKPPRPSALKREVQAHRSAVYCVRVHNNAIYTASQDHTLAEYDRESFILRRRFSGHNAEVMSICASGSMLVSADSDGVMKFWDVSTAQCIQTEQHRESVLSIVYADGKFFSAGVEGTIKVHPHANKTRSKCSSESVTMENAEKHSVPSLMQHQVWAPNSLYFDYHQNIISSSGSQLPTLNMVDALRKWIAVPTISAVEELRSECWRGAYMLKEMLDAAGFETRLAEGREGKNPIVLGRLGYNPDKPTVAFYGHYDVFPVREEQWRTPPFQMCGRDGYLYGRGVTDDKGPLLAMLYAVKDWISRAKATMRACKGCKSDPCSCDVVSDLPLNIVFIVEGEEECDSEGFTTAIEKNISFLEKIDVILLSNTVWLGDNVPCLHYGLRGVLDACVEVHGPSKNLHSGVDGGVIHEPMANLVRVLSTLTDNAGRVAIEGFYDDVRPVDEDEMDLYRKVQFDLELYKRNLGVERLLQEGPEAVLRSRWCEPTLSIHSIGTSAASNSSSIIPARATARVGMRLVPNQEPEKVFSMLESHVKKKFAELHSQNYVSITQLHSGNWWLGDRTTVYFRAALQAIHEVWKIEPLQTREGGTIPLTRYLETTLNAPALHLPLGQRSDSAHLDDERIRLENLLKGREVIARFLCHISDPVVPL